MGVRYHQAWVSPLTRAQQTLEIIQDAQDNPAPVKVVEELAVFGDPDTVYDLLEEHYKKDPNSKLLLVGHNPNMTELVELLASEEVPEMRTSDMAWVVWDEQGPQLRKFYPRGKLMDLS